MPSIRSLKAETEDGRPKTEDRHRDRNSPFLFPLPLGEVRVRVSFKAPHLVIPSAAEESLITEMSSQFQTPAGIKQNHLLKLLLYNRL